MRFLSLLLCITLATCALGVSPFFPYNGLLQKVLPFAKRAPQAVCSKMGCESGSGECGTLGDTFVVCTKDHSFCPLSSNGTGVCTAPYANGQACHSDSQCESEYCSYGTSNDVCAEPPRQNGQSCTSSSQCVSSICTSGVCQNKASGDSCSYNNECAADYYCDSTSKCTKRAALGEECMDFTTDSCMQGYMCSANDRCIVPYTTMSGGLCEVSAECMDGLACISSSNGTIMMTCAAVGASSGSACTADSDCTRSGEICLCNARLGTQSCHSRYINNVAGIAGVAKDLSDCLVGACKGNTYEDACMQNSCKKQSCKFTSVSFSIAAPIYKDIYPTCFYDTLAPGGGYCGSASTAALSAAAVAAAVIAYLL